MRTQTHERRPAGNEAAIDKEQQQTHPQSTIPALSRADVETLAARVDHAIVVTVGLPRGGSRSRVYLTVGGADRALRAARERHAAASLALVRLAPVAVSREDLAAMLAGGEGR